MSEKNKATGRGAAPAESMIAALVELQKVGFGPIAWMGTAWMERLGDMSSEVLNFVAERIKEDVKTQHRILHCKDIGEMQHIQAQFVQRAIDQYTAETGKLVEMGNNLLTEVQGKSKE